MRVGSNPYKRITGVKTHTRVTIALLVHIPNNTGYFEESFRILRLCLHSIYCNTVEPYELLVFDNGSNQQVVKFILDEQGKGRIDYFIRSNMNLGKVNALNILISACPGEYVVYSDSDVFFFPDWMRAHIDILETFPNVGMVTGLPMRHLVDRETVATKFIARNDPEFQIDEGNLLDIETIVAFCDGVSYPLKDYLERYGDGKDMKLRYRGVEAYVGASHFQFAARKEILLNILPLSVDTSAMLLDKNSDRQLDHLLDVRGYMRLSTRKAYVHHLGNHLSDHWRKIEKVYYQMTHEMFPEERKEQAASKQKELIQKFVEYWKKQIANRAGLKRIG